MVSQIPTGSDKATRQADSHDNSTGNDDTNTKNENKNDVVKPTKKTNDTATEQPTMKFGLFDIATDNLANRLFPMVEDSIANAVPSTEDLIRAKKGDGSIKDADWYNKIFQTISWQRDNYLIGHEYAVQRKMERKRKIEGTPTAELSKEQDIEEKKEEVEDTIIQLLRRDSLLTSTLPFALKPHTKIKHPKIPYDPTALGNIQLQRLGTWFIPSPTVFHVFQPMAVQLPKGPLYGAAFRGMSNLIPMQQAQMDQVMKTNLIWLLNNDEWKDIFKRTTNTHLGEVYRDAQPARRGR
mmetsp:Transcript_25218/g.38818  ORF Transcript_25218/g.38818 Transcript_25218/m.38818 type:complete len:295 (+) Transcript_25218:82-966(+)